MNSLSELNSYIKTRNSNFNRFAIRLYLENTKQAAFPTPGQPLEIFKFIFDKMGECGSSFFSFVEAYQQFISNEALTTAQSRLICRAVIEFLASDKYKRDLEFETEHYLEYFRTLDEIALKQIREAALSTQDTCAMIDELIQKQVLSLSEEMDKIPPVQKIRVIAGLVKILPQYTKIKMQAAKALASPTADECKPADKTLIPVKSAVDLKPATESPNDIAPPDLSSPLKKNIIDIGNVVHIIQSPAGRAEAIPANFGVSDAENYIVPKAV